MDCVLGDYRLLEKVGAGGMGEVWRAENVHTRVVCAVKLLPVEAASDRNFVARFFDEGRLMQTLDHPHIVRVHHVGHDEKRGRYYLVMDFVEGPEDRLGPASPSGQDAPHPRASGYPCSLHDMLVQTPDHRLPEREVARWVLQVAEALAYAHAQGVVHRDIKPANVMVDRSGNARVTDFGLAKAVGETYLQSQIHASIAKSMGGGSVNSLRTRRDAASAGAADRSIGELPTLDSDSDKAGGGRSSADALLGTYDYMAPEQRGDITAAVSPASDIYAFGVMLYRLLTGRRPAGMTKPISQVVPGLARKWDRLCARCLEHNPADRYADGAALCREMRGVASLANGRRARRVAGIGYWVLGIGAAAVLAFAAHQTYQSYRSQQSHRKQVAAQDAAVQARVVDLKTAAETALAAGDLETAGARIAELRSAGGPAVVSAGLQKRYEAKAGERETTKRYAAASVARDAVMKLDAGQGFGERLTALEVTWREAEAARQGGGWGQALSGYDAVITACRALEELDKARGDAEARRGEAEQARRDAAGANAAEDAKELFETGGRASSRAAEVFEKGDFPASGKAWLEAAAAFASAKTRALTVQAYRKAKADFEAALAADEPGSGGRASPRVGLLDMYGGDKWREVRRQQRIGAASTADPVEGKRAYAAALAALPAAVAEALAAEKAEAEQARLGKVAAALTAARAAKAAGRWQECLDKAAEALDLDTDHTEAAVLKLDALKRLMNLYQAAGNFSNWIAAKDELEKFTNANKIVANAIAQATLEAQKEPQPIDTQTVDLGGGVRLELVWCPAGSFTMGSPSSEAGRGSDETQHRVTLTKGFWMGKCEVTQGQWEAVMGSNPSNFKNAGRMAPVEQVSWDDCQEFVRKVNARVAGGGFRLPTEAEWEYACRAGTASALNSGKELTSTTGRCLNLDEAAWYGETSGGTTHPVGERQPNAWGLYDMHGNVWEWCADWYGEYPSGIATDPLGPGSGSDRVGRGGGWLSNARLCRSANRRRNDPGRRNDRLGLRLARSPQ